MMALLVMVVMLLLYLMLLLMKHGIGLSFLLLRPGIYGVSAVWSAKSRRVYLMEKVVHARVRLRVF